MATARIPAEIVAEDKFTPELKKIQAEIAKTNSQLGAFGSLLKGLGSVVSVGLIVDAFKSVVDGLDQIDKRSQALGFTVESLQEIQYAAQFAGVRAAEFDTAMSRLNIRMDAAAAGSKEAARTFRDLGIDVKDANGAVISTDRALGQIADKFKTYRDGPEKAALANELFGRSGYRLIPFLNQGSEGIERLREEARKLGIVIGEDNVKAASQFNDEMTKLNSILRSITVDAFMPLIRGLNNLVGEFDAAKAAGQSFTEVFAFTFKYFNLSAKEADDAIRQINKDIKERQRIIDSGLYFLIDKDKLREEIKALEREKKALDLIYQKRSPPPFEANFDQVFGLAVPPRSDRGGGARESTRTKKLKFDDADSKALQAYIDKLAEAAVITDDLTIVEKTLYEIRRGAFGELSTSQEELLIQMSAMAERTKGIALAEKTANDARKAADAQRKSDIEQIRQLTGEADEERADRLLRLIEAEVALGNISHEAAQRATRALLGITTQAGEAASAVEQLGVTFLSSLGKFIEGDYEGNVFQALLDDVKKLIVQMLILEPLIRDFKKILKDTSGGGEVQSILGLLGLISGSTGGGGGQVFASGGYLRPGQFGVAGDEGPELIYGGRAGMTIWPNGSGAGGGVVINQQISVDSRSDRATIMQAMLMAKDQAKAEIMQSMNTNGAFSRR